MVEVVWLQNEQVRADIYDAIELQRARIEYASKINNRYGDPESRRILKKEISRLVYLEDRRAKTCLA